MNESDQLTQTVRELRERGEPFVVATVVRISGSAYRRPGARMVIAEGRHLAGSVSGGCIEADVVRRGFFQTEQAPRVVRYDASVDDELRDGFGIGCDGVVEVLLERGAPTPNANDPFRLLERAAETQRPIFLATTFRADDPREVGHRRAFDEQGNCLDDSPETHTPRGPLIAALRQRPRARGFSFSSSGRDVLLERLSPPPELFVFGTGHDVVPLVRLATTAGFRVTVCEQAGRLDTRERFHGLARVLSGPPASLAEELRRPLWSAAVVMGHHLERDARALDALLDTRTPYIGVLGPRTRTTRLFELIHRSMDTERRVFAPAGLRLGGDSPASVAVSLLAEIQAVLSRGALTDQTGRLHLRDHDGPIHDRDDAEADGDGSGTPPGAPLF